MDEPGCEKDAYGQPCTVVIGSAARNISKEDAYFVGTGIAFHDGIIDVSMIDSEGNTVYRTSINEKNA